MRSGPLRGTQAGTCQERYTGAPTQLWAQMYGLASLGQVLYPAQHDISMSRCPPTPPTTAAPERSRRGSPGGSVERAAVDFRRRKVAAFSAVNGYWPDVIFAAI